MSLNILRWGLVLVLALGWLAPATALAAANRASGAIVQPTPPKPPAAPAVETPRVQTPKVGPPEVKTPEAVSPQPESPGERPEAETQPARPLKPARTLSDDQLALLTEKYGGLDLKRLAAGYPSLKTIFLLAYDRELDLDRLTRLLSLNIVPVNGSLVDYLGRSWGIFHTSAGNLARLAPKLRAKAVVPLARFVMRGLYRIHFKIMEPGFSGPLRFSVTTPKSSFGKRLLKVQDSVYPKHPSSVRIDEGGNRWLDVELPEAKTGDILKLDFSALYRVDIKKLIHHSIYATAARPNGELPADSSARAYLGSGAKITPEDEMVVDLAAKLFGQDRVPRRLWFKVNKYIKDNIPYDHKKRAQFFGGRKVYKGMADMYDPPRVILTRKVGACPETSVLEASLFRAVGIPARTAGRWGHFFTELFIPGRGWVSTSVTPTGIPLQVDKDANHLPFVEWSERIAVKTTRWTGEVRIRLDE